MRSGSIHIVMGNKAALVVHAVDGAIAQHFIVDNEKLSKAEDLHNVLAVNPDARITLYLNNADITCTRRLIAAQSKFEADELAKGSLVHEVEEHQIRTAILADPPNQEQRRWVYSFISTPKAPVLTEWLNFLQLYHNKIVGLYLLPVAIGDVLNALRGKDIADWEVLVWQNSTDGISTLVFYHGALVWHQIVENPSGVEHAVMAGHIEQRATDGLDYIHKSPLHGGSKVVSVSAIVGPKVAEYVRVKKIAAEIVRVITPNQAVLEMQRYYGVEFPKKSQLMDQEGYFDLAAVTYCIANMPTSGRVALPPLGAAYTMRRVVDFMQYTMCVFIALSSLVLLYVLYGVVQHKIDYSELRTGVDATQRQIDDSAHSLAVIGSKVQGGVSMQVVREIYNLDAFLNRSNETPVSVFLRLSETLPEYARVKQLRWKYTDPNIGIFMNAIPGSYHIDFDKLSKWSIEVNFNMVVLADGKVGALKEMLETKFPYATVQLSTGKVPRSTYVNIRLASEALQGGGS